MSPDFWSPQGRQAWPRDAGGHVFMGRAVDQIGRAMFGVEWGPDAMRSVHRRLPRASVRTRSAAPARGSTGAAALETDASIRPIPAPPPAVEPEFLQNLKLRAEAQKRMMDSVHQLQERVIQAACRGDLVFAYRQNGALVAVATRLWNEPGVESRFVRCSIDPKKPFFNTGLPGANYRDLYVTEASLAEFVKMQPKAEMIADGTDLARFSPYLQFAVRLAIKWNADGQWKPSKHQTLVYEIQAEWKRVFSTELNPTSADHIAWVLKHQRVG